MIDWLDLSIELLHDPLPAGRVMSIDPAGQIDWETSKRMEVRGSYDSKIFFRSQGGNGAGQATQLYISGNPSKFLQGHNVFGCEDIGALVAGVLTKASDQLPFEIDMVRERAKRGDFTVKRIDITRSFGFGSRQEVKSVLSYLAVNSRSRMGRPQTKGTTVYHGMGSRRWSLMWYCKGDEVEKKGRIPSEMNSEKLKAHADKLLRAELKLLSKELDKREITHGYHLTPKVIDELYRDYFGRIDMSAQAKIPSDELVNMRRCIRDTYLMWSNGIDVQGTMKETTFYRHRADLLAYGIDIAIAAQPEDSKVIPLFRQVTGSPAGIPDWAYESGMVFDPNRVGG
jgi:II/X family phage/plasmid replication protein